MFLIISPIKILEEDSVAELDPVCTVSVQPPFLLSAPGDGAAKKWKAPQDLKKLANLVISKDYIRILQRNCTLSKKNANLGRITRTKTFKLVLDLLFPKFMYCNLQSLKSRFLLTNIVRT